MQIIRLSFRRRGSVAVVVKNILDLFSNVSPELVLSFQAAFFQSLIPILLPMMDEKIWRVVSPSASPVLPYEATPSDIVAMSCLLCDRAAVGFVPRNEHTVLGACSTNTAMPLAAKKGAFESPCRSSQTRALEYPRGIE